MRTRWLIGAALLAVVTAAGALTGILLASPSPSPGPALSAATTPATGRTALQIAIQKAQVRLRTLPRDDVTWAQLGAAYVQQARLTADPSYYPKAAGALQQSLQLHPDDNVAADVGQGSLANARHEFAAAAVWGRRAAAADAYSAGAQAVLTDAYTQLGRYSDADRALQRMLDLQPGLSSFSRASYAYEERGDITNARKAMQRALSEATDPGDIAFCRYYLGELDFNTGDPQAALEQYRLGLISQPDSPLLLAGRAKSEAAVGRSADALRDYAQVTEQLPLPDYVLEYGQLLQSLGHADEAAQQYALLLTEQRLFAANGVVDDLTMAVYAADHGSATDAVTHARAEWSRRHSVLVADALSWALYRDGREAEALRYAKTADRLGWRNATFAYHRGMIEKSLGMRSAARRDLAASLKINPYFSPLQAPVAKAALASLSKGSG